MVHFDNWPLVLVSQFHLMRDYFHRLTKPLGLEIDNSSLILVKVDLAIDEMMDCLAFLPINQVSKLHKYDGLTQRSGPEFCSAPYVRFQNTQREHVLHDKPPPQKRDLLQTFCPRRATRRFLVIMSPLGSTRKRTKQK